MDYNHIKTFLEKFKKLVFQKEESREIVVKTISLEISHEVEKDSVKIKNGVIFIQGSPILRSEIMMHKNKILIKLKSILPGVVFLDIK
jgi:hypothetical protein